MGLGFVNVPGESAAAVQASVNTALNAAANAHDQANNAYNLATDINGILVSTNIAFGYNAIASGSNSTALGRNTNASDTESTALGHNAIASKAASIAIGSNVIASNIQSTALGFNAISSGRYSTALGSFANATGVNSTALGRSASAAGSNSTAIGYNAEVPDTSTNTIQLGDGNVSALKCKVGVTTGSDLRDKINVVNIADGAVEFLNKIRAIQYLWNGRSLYIDDDENLSEEDRVKKGKYGLCTYDKEEHAKGTKAGKRLRVGVAAHEVQQALKEVYGSADYANIVNDNFYDLDPSEIPEDVENQLTVTYDSFIPFLIKAIQELSERIVVLEAKGA